MNAQESQQRLLIAGFRYKEWSDRRTMAAIRRMDVAQHAASAAFVRQQLNHMVIVEELFKARLLGAVVPHGATNTAQVPPLDELDRRLQVSDQWFSDCASNMRPSQMDQRLFFGFTDGQRGTMTRLEILFHIINHGTYHRGAIGHALDLAGAAHPADTYTVFIHEVEPDRRTAVS